MLQPTRERETKIPGVLKSHGANGNKEEGAALLPAHSYVKLPSIILGYQTGITENRDRRDMHSHVSEMSHVDWFQQD